jgi:hypothetical protein
MKRKRFPCYISRLEREIQVVPERDGKTNCWIRVDGNGTVNPESNQFKKTGRHLY